MKIKNQHLIDIWNSLQDCKITPPIPREFVRWRNKTLLAIEYDVKSLAKASQLDKELWEKQIEEKNTQIENVREKYSLRDDSGKILMDVNGNSVITDRINFIKEIEFINKVQFIELYNEEIRIKKEYEKILDNETEIVLEMIEPENLPASFNSMDNSLGLFRLVK